MRYEHVCDFTTPPLYTHQQAFEDCNPEYAPASPPTFVCVLRWDNRRYDLWFAKRWRSNDDSGTLMVVGKGPSIYFWATVREIVDEAKFERQVGPLLLPMLNAAYVKRLATYGCACVIFDSADTGLTRYQTGPDGAFELGQAYVLDDVKRRRDQFDVSFLRDDGSRRLVTLPPGAFRIVGGGPPPPVQSTTLRQSVRQIVLADDA